MAQVKTDESVVELAQYALGIFLLATVTSDDRAPESLAQPATVTHRDVARRAYDLYLARGCEHGHDANDWARAERELRSDRTIDDRLQVERDRHA
jgi:hypothetical protein